MEGKGSSYERLRKLGEKGWSWEEKERNCLEGTLETCGRCRSGYMRCGVGNGHVLVDMNV